MPRTRKAVESWCAYNKNATAPADAARCTIQTLDQQLGAFNVGLQLFILQGELVNALHRVHLDLLRVKKPNMSDKPPESSTIRPRESAVRKWQ